LLVAESEPPSRNSRDNTALLLTHAHAGATHRILFDCGKTFRASAVRFFQQVALLHYCMKTLGREWMRRHEWMKAWRHEWLHEWVNEDMNEWMNEGVRAWMNVW
jgi:hypothetical protein